MRKKRNVAKIMTGFLALGLGIATLGYSGYESAVTVQAATIREATVTATSLKVRTGAGTSYARLTSDGTAVNLQQGEVARIIGEENGWYQVTFEFQGKEVTGYISGDYVTVSTREVAVPVATVTAAKLNVRSGAGTSYDKVTSGGVAVYLSQGEKAEILSEQSGWYQVSFTFQGNAVTGYISADYVTVAEETLPEQDTGDGGSTGGTSDVGNTGDTGNSGTSSDAGDAGNTGDAGDTGNAGNTGSGSATTNVEYLPLAVSGRITATSLKVRTGPGTDYKQLAVSGTNVSLKQNETITITGTETNDSGRWYQITFTYKNKEQTGYVLSDYVTLVMTPGERVRVDAGMNKKQYVRTSASTESSAVTYQKKKVALGKGDDCYIISEETVGGVKWFQVKFFVGEKALKGYVRAAYVDFRQKAVVTEVPDENTGTTEPGDTGTSGEVTVDEDIVDDKNYEPLNIPGRVLVDGVTVYSGSGTDKEPLTVDGAEVTLGFDANVTITDMRKKVSGKRWYQISFTRGEETLTGYVPSEQITLVMVDGERVRIDGILNESQHISKKAKAGEKYYETYNDEPLVLEKDTECWIISETLVDGAKWFQIKFYYDDFPMKGYVLEKYVDFPRVEIIPEPVAPEGTGSEEAFQMQQGVIMNGPVQPRVAAGYTYEVNRDSATGLAHTLTSGQEVTAFSRTNVDGLDWYMITYEMNGSIGLGFLPATNVQLSTSTGGTSSGSVGSLMTEAEFEAYMTSQGFPESYKPYLRTLHAQHPYWIFEAQHVGLDWNTVITNESKVGLNLITNSKNLAWKSMETGAYNWKTDKFVPYDGSTWVTVSKEALEYYMDPRNFLTETGIFQFELLSYQPAYQTIEGVEAILAGTPMQYASYTYTDSNGVQQTTTYAQTFMDAAAYSGVSPYHLATRVKQEVVTSSTSMSSSVSGQVSGYEGLYNFYNIGATHSTVAGGAVANGLKYARTGTAGKYYDSTTTFNDHIMIPWTDPYRAIVGGAAFIGYNYIERGQNTVYLEKFNVTSTSTYSHQYMANVEAGASESAKTAAAYSQLAASPLIFSIPVYQNMPATVCAAPADKLNPNNWLKSLEVDGYSLTPTFNPASDQVYTLIVPAEVEQVTINATTASKKASVSGAGVLSLVPGNNTAVIVVTAEDGTPRLYLVTITREIAPEPATDVTTDPAAATGDGTGEVTGDTTGSESTGEGTE